MKKSCIALTAVLLAISTQATNKNEPPQKYGLCTFLSVTPTNLMLRVGGWGGGYMISYNPEHHRPTPRSRESEFGSDYIYGGDMLHLIPDQAVSFGERHSGMEFIPVIFKNRKKGFRIIAMSYWGETITNSVDYVAFGKKLVKMAEEDVMEDVKIPKRENGLKFLEGYRLFNSLKVTPTHLSFMYPSLFSTVKRDGIKVERTAEDRESIKELLVFPDQETAFLFSVYEFTFTPVSFKDKTKGFKITAIADNRRSGYAVTTNTAYLALSDAPVPVGEVDVKMIMESGKWKKFDGKGGAMASPPSRLWLYALIPLFLFAILYFIRRKRVRSVLHRRGNN